MIMTLSRQSLQSVRLKLLFFFGGEDAKVENDVNNFKIKIGDNYCWNYDSNRVWNRMCDLVSSPVSQ